LGEMKSRFVSMASHEFRTPLAIIQAASDLLKHYNHKLSEQKRLEKLDKIQLEVKNMTELLEDVLTIGKIELGKLHLNRVQMDLEKFCQDSIDEFKSSIDSSDRIEFIAQNRGGVKPVNIFADPKLLRQVIINLMSNGIKYSLTSPKKLKVNLFYDATSFDLEFIDCGIGIPLNDRHKIFESFHRGDNVGNISGTGLGLAIAQASIELHKGKIIVDSQVDIGTTMTITIPYE
jgi:signal transduction histidine kinase